MHMLRDLDPRNLQLGSTGGLNGAKKEFLEGGIRVPFILNWPAAIKGTQEYHHPVTTLDLYPTLCGIAGVQLPAGIQLDGIDLMPNLIPVAQAPKERTLLWFAGPSGAIREGDWKLVFDPENGKRLYNLRLDPYETKDLSVINTQIARSLWAIIIAWGKSIPPPVTPEKI
jgi:arylsulfatase A-like enzyme